VRPETVRDFMRLASMHIRRILIELARHYFRPAGLATNHVSIPGNETAGGLATLDTPSDDPTPSQLVSQSEQWDRLHAEVERLPDDEREVVELIWFHGLTQAEVAQIAGITERTVQRRWIRARLKLFTVLEGELPGMERE
jgi:RNA polymerase sigma-70 factor (ECF subfamily)